MTDKKILVDATFPHETRVVLLNENGQIEDHEYETANKYQIKSNIYVAEVTRIEQALQAVFIIYEDGKKGFLPFDQIHPSYFHLPDAERSTLGLPLLKNLNHIDSLFHPIKPALITPEDLKEKDVEQQDSKDQDDNLLDLEESVPKIDNTASDDIQEVTTSTKVEPIYKKYQVQNVIKKGQLLLVQAQKEERGNKGAAFTTFISLAGRYCVLMPNKADQNGISRRIANVEERKRLKNIINVMNPKSLEASVVVRTAGYGKTSYELKRDYEYLTKLWNKILEVIRGVKHPVLVHMEDDILKKTIRDLYDRRVTEILVQGHNTYLNALEFMRNILPSDVYKLKEYTDKLPLFTRFNIEEQLSELYQPVVNLSSGAYIVINPTEALISIDVNSGKAISEKNIEETAFKTNLEAIKEIARQARLRDLSGIIVIDFIDMAENKNKKLIEKALKIAFGRDKAKTQIGSITSLGLMEISRQRLRASFTEANAIMCEHCSGKGIVRSPESNAILILRTIESEIWKGEHNIVNVYTNLVTVLYILNNKRQEIKLIEAKHDAKINFLHDSNSTSDSFWIEKVKYTISNEDTKQPILISAQQLADIQYNSLDAMPTPLLEANRVKWNNNVRLEDREAKENFDTGARNRNSKTSTKIEPSLDAVTSHSKFNASKADGLREDKNKRFKNQRRKVTSKPESITTENEVLESAPNVFESTIQDEALPNITLDQELPSTDNIENVNIRKPIRRYKGTSKNKRNSRGKNKTERIEA